MTPTQMLRATGPAAFSFLPAACAQQPQPAPVSGMNMPGMNMPGMNMSGTKMHDMAGMGMQAMMNRCAQMRPGGEPGQAARPGLQSMTAQCDQMDRGMATSMPAPAATRPR